MSTMEDRRPARDRKRLQRERAALQLAVVQRLVLPEMAARLLLDRYGIDEEDLGEGLQRLVLALIDMEGINPNAD